MLNINSVTVPHSFSSFSARLVLLHVCTHTTIVEENEAIRMRRLLSLLRSAS